MHRAEELLNNSHRQMKDEEGRRIAIVDTFNVAEKRIEELNTKLTEADRDKKSAEVPCKELRGRWAEDQLTVAKEQIENLKKKLEEAEKAVDKAKQDGYVVGVVEIEEVLRAEVFGVCITYFKTTKMCNDST